MLKVYVTKQDIDSCEHCVSLFSPTNHLSTPKSRNLPKQPIDFICTAFLITNPAIVWQKSWAIATHACVCVHTERENLDCDDGMGLAKPYRVSLRNWISCNAKGKTVSSQKMQNLKPRHRHFSAHSALQTLRRWRHASYC